MLFCFLKANIYVCSSIWLLSNEKQNQMNPIEFSYYIVDNYSDISTEGITHLKLQKLLYYIHVWGIVSNQNVLDAKFKKWEKGPVNDDVYYHFKEFGSNKIIPNTNTKKTIKDSEKEFVDFVIDNYSKYSAVTLSAMTHQDLPWIETPKNQVISSKSIINFYGKLNFAKNFPLDPLNKPYYPVETDLHYSFVLDLPSAISKKPFAYASYYKYLELEKKSKEVFEKEMKQWFDLKS